MPYLRALWLREDPDRRALRLERYEHPYEDEDGLVHSVPVLELIENRPVGVMGNLVAFPLQVQGQQVLNTGRDGRSMAELVAATINEDRDTDIRGHLSLEEVQPQSRRVSLPTRGVYAETLLSKCNATEERDINRMIDPEQRCDLSAPDITGITPGSRRSDMNLQPSQLPGPSINIQNPPNAPAPTGMSALLEGLASGNIFRDMSLGSETVGAAQALADKAMKESGAAQRASLKALNNLLGQAQGEASSDTERQALQEAQSAVQAAGQAAQQKANEEFWKTDPRDLRDREQAINESQMSEGDKAQARRRNYNAEDRPTAEAAFGKTEEKPEFAGEGAATSQADLSRWTDLINFVPSTDIQKSVRNRFGSGPDDWSYKGWPFHPLPLAEGDMSVDLYGIVIEKMPQSSNGAMSPSELLHHIRTHINDFVDTDNSSFKPFDEQADKPRWMSKDPVGAAVHINTYVNGINADDLTVVVTDAQFDASDRAFWQFSTCYGPWNGNHPLAGNRRWEIFALNNGSYAFRIMAADSPWTTMDSQMAVAILGGAKDLWMSMLKKVTEYIESNQGQVAQTKSIGGDTIPDLINERTHGIPWKKEQDEKLGTKYFYMSKGNWVEYAPTNNWLPSSSSNNSD